MYTTWKNTAEMNLQTPGLLGILWCISDTASIKGYPHGSCSKYQFPFEASSSARFQKADLTTLRMLSQFRTLWPFMHYFWYPATAIGIHI